MSFIRLAVQCNNERVYRGRILLLHGTFTCKRHACNTNVIAFTGTID